MILKNYLPSDFSRCRHGIWLFSWTVPLTALFALLIWLLPASPLTQADNKIAPNLQTILAKSEANEPLRYIVHLQDSVDFSQISFPVDKIERRAMLIQQLQDTAESSQSSLIVELGNRVGDGRIISYRPLWIINAIAVVGTADTIQQIAIRPEVKQIELDATVPLMPPPAQPEYESFFQFLPSPPPTTTYSWGIDRIRAPQVWHGLGYDGTGITVAIMDSGVDWSHPDLLPNYRGNLGGGNYQHTGNWYHAATPTVTIPIDLVGHGTHVAGTAVGQNGIGVAPGAKWIATSIVDQSGFIFNSYIHAAFEWLLAPNGNPSLAPDVINGSWGGPGNSVFFLEDMQALYTAGIVPVFAAGNNGPFEGSILMPASYPEAIAVGASDIRDELTWFSSRGPSIFTSEPRPAIIAPGTLILSTFPNNSYAYNVGTSMSAPHASGAVALLLSANPGLSVDEVKQALTATAVPIDPPHPNNDSGWGRLDIYAAVSEEVAAGTLQGTVESQGVPLANISLTLTTPSGAQLPFVTDENGQYEIKLQPGTYALAINAFGFAVYNASGLTINNVNHTLTHNISLTALPAGTLTGFILTAEDNSPLTATIRVEGAPVVAETDSSGQYILTLPVGQYDLVIQSVGRRLLRTTHSFIAGQTQNQTFHLISGPAIMLVDSGQWYYDSKINYYQDILETLDYSYQIWEIHDPYFDAPTYADLEPYDTLIWNSPQDSPGLVSAGPSITQFLEDGGHFFVSGQDIANYDGLGLDAELWWYRDLEAQYNGAAEHNMLDLTGTTGTLFEGLSITLNGSNSAQNQVEPDTVRTPRFSLTQPIFQYGDGRFGGLQRDHCKPFSLIYLGFGLEGVTEFANRQAILERAFDYFSAPPLDRGLRWVTADIDDYAPPDTELNYTLTVQNLSETITDTIILQIENSQWASSLLTTTLTLGPCETGQTVLTLDVPPNLPQETVHEMQVIATSTTFPSQNAQLHIRHQTPGQILFVDDDRWYERQDALINSLDQMGLSYDIWETGWPPSTGRGSPSTELLQAYDIIVWYTGYDWFRPITTEENEAIHDYLAEGGRLFLTSQDYLYYHWHQPVVQDYFGLLTYQEAITPTQVYANNTPVVPNQLAGPVPLGYKPYINYSDGLIAAQPEQVVLWGDQGMAAGTINAGLTSHNQDWRLVFWSIPFETMTTTAYLPALNGIMGWLGDMGESTFTTENRVVASGAPQTYTLMLKNLPSAPTNQISVVNNLPTGLGILPSTITGDAVYDSATHQLTWEGNLDPGAEHIIRYQAVPNSGPRLDNQVTIFYERHKIPFSQTATVWIKTSDLSSSQLMAVSNTPSPSPLITYTLHLKNDGFTSTNGISAVVRLPDAFYPLTDTLHFGAGSGFLAEQRIHWRGDLLPGEAVTMTLRLTATLPSKVTWHSATAVVQDGLTDTEVFYALLPLQPFSNYWPFFADP